MASFQTLSPCTPHHGILGLWSLLNHPVLLSSVRGSQSTEAVFVSQVPEGSLQSLLCLAQAAPSVRGQSCGTNCTLPTDSCPCWRRRSMGQTLQSGSRASPCRPQREPNWCPGQVRAACSRLTVWPSWLSSAPPGEEGLRLVAGGQCRRARQEWESQAFFAGHSLPLTSIPIVSSFTLSYGQRCSCSQRPHLQPHHGWEQQQLLEPGFRRC